MWYASVAVWGDWHRRLFLEGSLPSLLRPGNLPALADEGIRYVIHTDDPGLLAGLKMAELRQLADVEIRPVQEDGDEWERSAAANREVLAEADGNPVLFLNADMFLSEGALVKARRRLDAGARLVAVCGLRADQDAPMPTSTKPRDLIAWFLDHMHPTMIRSVWGNPERTAAPSITFFPAECGLIARAFHLHPLIVRAPRGTQFHGTIDDDLVARMDPKEVRVITDSDEIAVAEISPRTRTLGEIPGALTPEALHTFAQVRANAMHWRFFDHRIVLRDCDRSTRADDAPVVAEVFRLAGFNE
jgi:hypothetical protein